MDWSVKMVNRLARDSKMMMRAGILQETEGRYRRRMAVYVSNPRRLE